MPEHKSLLFKVAQDNEPVIRHAVGMVVTILCIWLFHIVLGLTLGTSAQLFDRIPIVYVAHFGDSLAFLRFFWKMIQEF